MIALTEGRSVEPGVLAALVEAVRAAREAAGMYGVQLKGAHSRWLCRRAEAALPGKVLDHKPMCLST